MDKRSPDLAILMPALIRQAHFIACPWMRVDGEEAGKEKGSRLVSGTLFFLVPKGRIKAPLKALFNTLK